MTAIVEELEEEAWETRETFAYFGRASYMSSVLEVGLSHALMWGEFMMEEAAKIKATRGKGFDQKRYEADFDAFMEKQFAQTMGNIVRRATALPYFTDELKDRIAAAKKRRDYLTHHFWRDASVRFATSAGREAMRNELNEDAETFSKLDRDIDAALKVAREKLGVDDAVLEKYNETVMEKVRAGIPLD